MRVFEDLGRRIFARSFRHVAPRDRENGREGSLVGGIVEAPMIERGSSD